MLTVFVPAALRPFTGGRAELELEGAPATVRIALKQLFASYPGLRDRILDETGAVRPHVNIFVGAESIRFLGGLDAPVTGELAILPAVSGGAATRPGAAPKRIALISTGGTIEKTYDALRGVLENSLSVLDVMLASLELRGIRLERVRLMNKDSLDMTPADHTLIAETVRVKAAEHDGVVVVHGTDRLAVSGERCIELMGTPPVPVVFTGAMRPYELRSTDALQNLTEALLAVQLLAPGVYVVMHGAVLAFPGVVKDVERGTFVKLDR
jgi:L-asparaginase